MPAVPVLPGVTGFDGWTLWRRGLITAANVTWSADASDPNAQQNFILAQLAVNKGYNAIRLVLSAGSSDAAWDDMLLISVSGWSPTTVSNSGDTTAIANVPRLASSGVPVADIIDGSTGLLIEKGIAGQIDDICIKCAQLGLGVIFDVHDFFQRNDSYGFIGPIWQQSQTVAYGTQLLRDQLVALWQNIVRRWGPTAWSQAAWTAYDSNGVTVHYACPVIGYELLNEPAPDPALTFAQMQGTDNGKDVNDNNWYNLADRCIKAIRQDDTTTPIVVDAIYYGDAYGLKYFDYTGLLNDYTSGGAAVSAANRRIVYSFHCYGPQEFTHQGVTSGLYASLGMPYPLPSSARVRTTLYDGTRSAGSTATTSYLPFTGMSDLQARIQPALDFATAHSGVPIFVGEFSAVDPSLLRSDQVGSSNGSRAITQIVVNGSGIATVTLQDAPSITLYPYGAGGGGYTDYALAKIESATNSAYNHASTAVRIEGGNPLTLQAGGAAGAFQYTGLNGTTLGNGTTQVATLTLSPNASSSAIDAARTQYCKDVLSLCIGNRFSWAYWQEDGYVIDAATVNDAAYSGVFVGWRPSTAMSNLLTLAATRRTVSTS